MILPDTGPLPNASPRPTSRVDLGSRLPDTAARPSFQAVFTLASRPVPGLAPALAADADPDAATGADAPDPPLPEQGIVDTPDTEATEIAPPARIRPQMADGLAADQDDAPQAPRPSDPVQRQTGAQTDLPGPDKTAKAPLPDIPQAPTSRIDASATVPPVPMGAPDRADTSDAPPHDASWNDAHHVLPTDKHAKTDAATHVQPHLVTDAADIPRHAAPSLPAADSAPSAMPLQTTRSMALWPQTGPTPVKSPQDMAAPPGAPRSVAVSDAPDPPATPPTPGPVPAPVPLPDRISALADRSAILVPTSTPKGRTAQATARDMQPMQPMQAIANRDIPASEPGFSRAMAPLENQPSVPRPDHVLTPHAPISEPAPARDQGTVPPTSPRPPDTLGQAAPASPPQADERTAQTAHRDPLPDIARPALAPVVSQPSVQTLVPSPPAATPLVPPGQPLQPMSEEAIVDQRIFVSDTPEHAEIRTPADTPNPSRSLPDMLHRPELPRHISMQVVTAIQRGPAEKNLELTLNPAELGRVRISLTPGDAGIVVTILAERPETLDMMRRHVDTLAQDFLGLGYGRAEFNFGQTPQRSGTGDSRQMLGKGSSTGAEADDIAAPVIPNIVTDRVDIRL